MEARDRLLRRSSWLPLLARPALGTLPRLTGGRPVVCMGAFYYLMSAPIVVLPAYELVRRSLRSFCAGQPAPHGQCSRREGPSPPARRRGEGSTALRPSEGKGHRRLRTNRDYICIFYTTFSNERSKGAAGSPAATAPGEFQHRFGRRPRRRVGADRVAIASSAWRKLCSSNLVLMLVGVSEVNSKRATAVATHSSSVATIFMVRPGADGLRGRN